jgi:hypothetical protein|tara:strand:+ start:261 stop:713 length:453 start_codon:yes stop_codon:yes gene_type:complete
MADEQNSQSNDSEKNWKAMREENELLSKKVAEFEAKERIDVFNKAGLDTSKGVGKAVDMMYEGDLTIEGIQSYASEEFGVTFGQQDGIQDTVQSTEKSQERLNNIQKNSVVDIYDEDVIGQIREIEKTGNVRSSIAAKLAAIEEDKKAQK